MSRTGLAALAMLAAMTAFAGGCIHAQKPSGPDKLSYPKYLMQGKLSVEIKRLENIADGKGDESKRADACLRLALLLSHYENPSPDYAAASARLAEFERLRPDLSGSDEIRHFDSLLRALIMKTKALGRQETEMQRLSKENRRLEAEIKRLSEIIDKLNQLDLQLEQKRRSTK